MSIYDADGNLTFGPKTFSSAELIDRLRQSYQAHGAIAWAAGRLPAGGHFLVVVSNEDDIQKLKIRAIEIEHKNLLPKGVH